MKLRRLILLRHAPTPWNADKRLQGRSDVPVPADTLAALPRLPAGIAGLPCLSSPLARCMETARAHGLRPQVEPHLIEQDWGAWEGQRLPELRAQYGAEMQANEDRGLDFTPPGGESPRMVQARLRPLLQALADDPAPLVLITHKGVIRALAGLATGWDFMGRPPVRLPQGSCQIMGLDLDANLRMLAADLPLPLLCEPLP